MINCSHARKGNAAEGDRLLVEARGHDDLEALVGVRARVFDDLTVGTGLTYVGSPKEGRNEREEGRNEREEGRKGGTKGREGVCGA